MLCNEETMRRKTNKLIYIENIEHVYSGIDGRCCCGCSGTHFKYDNKRMNTRIVNIINKNIENVDIYDSFASVVIGKRLYVAYFKEKNNEKIS